MGSHVDKGVVFFNTPEKKEIYNPQQEFLNEIYLNELKEAEEKRKKDMVELQKKQQAELEKKLETLEIATVYSNVIIEPYESNPYQTKFKNGLILGEYDGSFTNPDSGESDKMKPATICAKVVEVGFGVNFCKPSDDVIVDSRGLRYLPYMDYNFAVIAEQNILAVLNEGLSERMKKLKGE